MTVAGIGVTWRRREPPLPIAAVAAIGTATDGIGLATRQRLEAGASLRVTAGDGYLVVLGDADDLPWADGATYLGWDGGLLVATTLQPSIPAELLRRALSEEGLVVALPGHVLVSDLPLRAADPRRLPGSSVG